MSMIVCSLGGLLALTVLGATLALAQSSPAPTPTPPTTVYEMQFNMSPVGAPAKSLLSSIAIVDGGESVSHLRRIDFLDGLFMLAKPPGTAFHSSAFYVSDAGDFAEISETIDPAPPGFECTGGAMKLSFDRPVSFTRRAQRAALHVRSTNCKPTLSLAGILVTHREHTDFGQGGDVMKGVVVSGRPTGDKWEYSAYPLVAGSSRVADFTVSVYSNDGVKRQAFRGGALPGSVPLEVPVPFGHFWIDHMLNLLSSRSGSARTP